ncbi:MAG: protein kinase [Gemmatimonadales bacterium]|nr:protein kinase [Gemmatimonadales bacterium]NIN13547.1 protein kinase [Gemmatimonadales bacterium]NIN51541.1 protein kinase [Gemmatimonadales bacterium]NIP09005.1 protein kinase [Gemmatimonadales bacterium]NIR03783.1 protein kinase [Gemmatimonadales bacterium]
MTELMDRLKDALADRYAIEREIGAGGMATVYLAEDLKHHRKVAVKVLKPELAVAIGAARFLREIEIAAQLTHPHILPLHDSGEADGFLYYVMPYIEGETLRGRIQREKQLSLDDALQITREVADGLAHAHSVGVVHRDIKPENVLLASGHAVVADFGIARAITEAGGERLTETGLSVGTPAYMSPEQAMGQLDVDARSDIYSLGCVAYEMLAGDPPFTGTNPQAILARKTLEPPPALRTARDTVPEAVEQPILRALAKVPADRFATAAQFRDALAIAPPSGIMAVPRPRRLTRTRALGLVSVFAVVLALGGVWMSRAFTDSGIESLAVLPFYNATGDLDKEFLVAGMHEALITTLQQIGALKVTSLTSTMRYKDTEKPIPQIARELDVDAVVEASVMRGGDSVGLEVQLIDARPRERELWSQLFEGSIVGALGMYNEVVRAIAYEAQVELTPDQQARLGSAREVRQDSYEAYLRGMFLLRKGTLEDSQKGLAYLLQARENDPADPLVHAALAAGYIMASHGPDPPLDALPRARAAAETALRLDSTLAETLTDLAFLKGYYDHEWEEAEQLLLRALEMKPSLDMAHYGYSWQLAVVGRMDEAIEEHKLACSLDPFNPLHVAGLGWLYLLVGRWEEAAAESRKALELDPQLAMSLYVLAEAHGARGEHEDALAVARQARPEDRGWILGRQLALAGHTEEARAIAAELEAEAPSPWAAWNLAVLYATLGENDDAFRWLNYEGIHLWGKGVGLLRPFKPLRGDPRLSDLLMRYNMPLVP